MMLDTSALVPMIEGKQNFSKAIQPIDQAARETRRQEVKAIADQLIFENLEAFQELAK